MPHHGPTGHWSVPLASPPEIAEAKSLVVDLIHQIHRLLLRGCKQRAQAASSYSIHHGTPLAQPPPLFFSPSASSARRSGVLDGNRGWPALPGAILRGAAAILPS